MGMMDRCVYANTAESMFIILQSVYMYSGVVDHDRKR